MIAESPDPVLLVPLRAVLTVVTLSCPPSDHLSLSGLRRHLRHRHSQLGRVICRAVSCCSHLSRRDIAQIFPVISVWSSRQSADGIPGCEDDKQALIRSRVQTRYKYGVRQLIPAGRAQTWRLATETFIITWPYV